jgi:hypothetical protein
MSVTVASAATTYFMPSASHVGSSAPATPTTGRSMYSSDPRPVRPFSIGSTDTAASAMPVYASSTTAAALDTRRFSPRRPTATSPASPDADSRPVNATVPTVSAKMKSFHVGVVPRSIDAVSASRLSATTRPTAMMTNCRAMSAVTSAAIRFQRDTAKPMTLRTAT